MLDTDTKRRIDTARDILVGKVPDPKSQVEQITLALIYKFMDDMDAESESFGGRRTFFAGDFARHAWSALMAPSLGGHAMLALYAEGIERMPSNPGVPQLFRDIFRNAFLPYRDPETLKAFLKVIDGFSYDHSERLGDAYEYLLSILGSQGDAGQFRTPRHIIDFIVDVIDPKKNETVLDPACGTAGFLISAYKHILAANTAPDGASTLTPDDRERLAENFSGYDIDPNMTRLARANLYLHGFADPKLHEYDTLTSDDRWNERFDVILANPPFMSPKGGIRPHDRFSIQAKRSEVLFVDYIAEHLRPGGRAGVIVPEGIVFQSQTAYRALRKMLVEKCLVAVVSLPAGCFNPYSGVKTSILFLDADLARRTDHVVFYKIANDGFGLGAQRRETVGSELPAAAAFLKTRLRPAAPHAAAAAPTGAYLADRSHPSNPTDPSHQSDFPAPLAANAQLVTRATLAANGDYNLSGERYRTGAAAETNFPIVRLGDIAEIAAGNPAPQDDRFFANGIHPFMRTSDVGKVHLSDNFKGSTDRLNETALAEINLRQFPVGTILFPKSGASTFLNHRVLLAEAAYVSSHLACIIADNALADPGFVYQMLTTIDAKSLTADQAYPSLRLADIAEIQIPLPPLPVQREIVAEIEGYQKVIDGARAVLDNYRPHIPIHPEWPMVAIGEISTIVRGSSPRPQGDPQYFGGPVPRLMVADITRDGMYANPQIDSLTELGATKSRPMKKGDVIITVSGNPGLPTILALNACIHDGFVGLRDLSVEVLAEYLYFALLALHSQHGSLSVGAVFKNLTTDQIREFKIMLPPLATQQAIVAEIEAEQALVAANRDLMARMEAKIQATLARVWGDAPAPGVEAAAGV